MPGSCSPIARLMALTGFAFQRCGAFRVDSVGCQLLGGYRNQEIDATNARSRTAVDLLGAIA